jgi:K+-transporting ATPase KdpF subunit
MKALKDSESTLNKHVRFIHESCPTSHPADLYAVLISTRQIQRCLDAAFPTVTKVFTGRFSYVALRALGAPARCRPLSPLLLYGASSPVSCARFVIMIWLVGLLTAALFAYLFYALIKPEQF